MTKVVGGLCVDVLLASVISLTREQRETLLRLAAPTPDSSGAGETRACNCTVSPGGAVQPNGRASRTGRTPSAEVGKKLDRAGSRRLARTTSTGQSPGFFPLNKMSSTTLLTLQTRSVMCPNRSVRTRCVQGSFVPHLPSLIWWLPIGGGFNPPPYRCLPLSPEGASGALFVKDKQALAEHLQAFIAEWNTHAHPFNWTTHSVAKVMAKCEPKPTLAKTA